MSEVGKAIRLARILDPSVNRTVITPLDDVLLAGPEEGLRHIGAKVQQVVEGGANAIMGFKGLFERHYEHMLQTGWILNLTASTTRSKHTRKVLISSVEEAVALGVDAVGVHVNISSEYETEMLRTLGEVSRQCDILGMPLMAIMYPRTEGIHGDNNYLDLLSNEPEKYAELVRHAARVGVDAGADLIKTQFTGSAETFATVVEACAPVPLVIAGGPKTDIASMLQKAYQAVDAGAAGISFGRNVFNRRDSAPYIHALRMIVFEGRSVEDAMQQLVNAENSE